MPKGFFNRLLARSGALAAQHASGRQAASVRRPCDFSSPGHFYSPLPDDADIARREPPSAEISNVDFRPADQESLLQIMAGIYPSLPFGDEAREGLRYRFNNPFFCYADAIYLHCLLRLRGPQRLIEVGSGFSSAVVLDTNEHFLNKSIAITFIEPNPERLHMTMRSGDQDRCRVLVRRVQDVPLEIFEELTANDILFIDSSHVSKVGSDVNHLFFHVLPRLAPGVLIHIHDIFYPFEYPVDWFREGRAWNEAYLVRAFLMHNRSYRILLFASYVGLRFRALLEAQMPLCVRNTGGSLWLCKEGQ